MCNGGDPAGARRKGKLREFHQQYFPSVGHLDKKFWKDCVFKADSVVLLFGERNFMYIGCVTLDEIYKPQYKK